MADTGDVGASEHGQSQAALVDVSDVITYLRRIIASLLDDQSEAVNIAFKEKSVQESLKKFISDHQVPALMIQRLTLKGEIISVYAHEIYNINNINHSINNSYICILVCFCV